MQAQGSVVGKPDVRNGVRIVEIVNGPVVLTYVENSTSPFRSPVIEERMFNNWTDALNFLKIWDAIRLVQWW